MGLKMSLRMEKLRANNFVKNVNHSNRRVDNINDRFLGKNIDRDRIKDNIFLEDNRLFEDMNEVEFREELEKRYNDFNAVMNAENKHNFKTKQINLKVKFSLADLEEYDFDKNGYDLNIETINYYKNLLIENIKKDSSQSYIYVKENYKLNITTEKLADIEILKKFNISAIQKEKYLKRLAKNKDSDKIIVHTNNHKNYVKKVQTSTVRKPFIKSANNITQNINGKNITTQKESSLMSEFIFQIGNSDSDNLKDILSDKQIAELYKSCYEELKRQVGVNEGTFLKSVIHNDEAHPHIHIFWTPYNLKDNSCDTTFRDTKDNLKMLQDNLHKFSKKYLAEVHKITLDEFIDKNTNERTHNLSVKEYKKYINHKKKMNDIDNLKTDTNKTFNMFFKTKEQLSFKQSLVVDNDKYILFDINTFKKGFKAVRDHYLDISVITQSQEKLENENAKLNTKIVNMSIENNKLKNSNNKLSSNIHTKQKNRYKIISRKLKDKESQKTSLYEKMKIERDLLKEENSKLKSINRDLEKYKDTNEKLVNSANNKNVKVSGIEAIKKALDNDISYNNTINNSAPKR